jgi:hypothetical protein
MELSHSNKNTTEELRKIDVSYPIYSFEKARYKNQPLIFIKLYDIFLLQGES